MIVRNATFPNYRPAEAKPALDPAKALAEELRELCREHNISPTRMGKAVARDPAFIMQLEEGRCPRQSTIDKVRRQMAKMKGCAA